MSVPTSNRNWPYPDEWLDPYYDELFDTFQSIDQDVQDLYDLITDGSRRRAVIDIVDCTAAPPTEVLGDRYILDFTAGTVHADWDGAAKGDIGEFGATSWASDTPEDGWISWVELKEIDYRFIDDGTPDWEPAPIGGSLNDSYILGRSITADNGAVEMTVPDTANNAVLVLNQDDETNTPDALVINKLDSDGNSITLQGDATEQILAAVSADFYIRTLVSGDLHLQAFRDIIFQDENRAGSTYGDVFKLSDAQAEWDDIETYFGEVSLFNILGQLGLLTTLSYSAFGGNIDASASTIQNIFDEYDRIKSKNEWDGSFVNSSAQIDARGDSQDIFSTSIQGVLNTSGTVDLTPDGTSGTELDLDNQCSYLGEAWVVATREEAVGTPMVKSWKIQFTVINDTGTLVFGGSKIEMLDSTNEGPETGWNVYLVLDSVNDRLEIKGTATGVGGAYDLTFQGGIRAQKVFSHVTV